MSATSYARNLIITELKGLISMIFEPGVLAYRKTSFIRDCHGCINVISALELFLKSRISLDGSEESSDLLFRHRLRLYKQNQFYLSPQPCQRL